jgi:putative hydrolase of the HAD superfamily
MAEIRAIISDFGGVLTSPLLYSFLALQDEIGISPEDFGKSMREMTASGAENPLYAMERGEISEEAFLEKLADGLEPILGHRPHMHRFRELFIGSLSPNEEMIELMRELKAMGLRMAMLTNNVREWEPTWRAMLPVDEIFETVIDSAFVGCRKPEPRIYELTLERIGMSAAECLFIDDIEVNCEGGKAAGMNVVHFQETEQAIAEIRAALGGQPADAGAR